MSTCENILLSHEEFRAFIRDNPDDVPLCGKPAVALRIDKPGREYTYFCATCMEETQERQAVEQLPEDRFQFIPLTSL